MTDLKPTAWLYTLHMEGGQKSRRLAFDFINPFGVRGEDYSVEYEVTSEPLYTKDVIEAENKALRDCLAKIAHNPSECTTGEGHARAVFLARAILAKVDGND